MATHVLTRTINGQRMRYFGCWGDKSFEALPYIKEYGYVPPGWQSYHLTPEEMKERNGPRFNEMKNLPIIAYGPNGLTLANAENDLRNALRDRRRQEAEIDITMI